MSNYKLDDFLLTSFKETRETLQSFSQLLTDIKKTFYPHQKNWDEHSLSIYAKGLTTGTMPVSINGKLNTLDLNLNFYENKLKIFCSDERLSVDLLVQSPKSFAFEVTKILNNLGIEYQLPKDKFDSDQIYYEKDQVINFWNTLKQVYFIFRKFQGGLLQETSNINFWPHHFDLAMLVFSGKIIDGKDPNDWSSSREQMNFGFSTGDDGIPEPYFYITAYPFDDELLKNELPLNTYWHTKGWKGAVMKYNDLVEVNAPDKVLLDFFNFVLNICFNK